MKNRVAKFLGVFNRINMAIFGYFMGAIWIMLLYPFKWITGLISGFLMGMFSMRMITKIKEWIEKSAIY